MVLLVLAAGCGKDEYECGESAGCAEYSARTEPELVRGTVPVRVTLTSNAPLRMSVRGPGGPGCRTTLVARTVTRPRGLHADIAVTPADFGRRGGAWCPGRYAGAATSKHLRLPVAFTAGERPRTRTVDRAARNFAALRRTPRQGFTRATRRRLREAGATIADAHLLGTAGAVPFVVAPVGRRLCVFAGDAPRVCRTPRQAIGRRTLSGSLATPKGPFVFALLPDGSGEVRVPTGPGRFRRGTSAPARVVDGFAAVALDPGRRPHYYDRGGRALPIRY